MRRREFIGALSATLALPFSAAAEQPGKVWRIGDVVSTTPELGRILAQALEQHLVDLGYVRDRNIVLLHRFSGPQPEKIQEAIISFVPQVDLLVAWGNAAIEAKKLAANVPTVFVSFSFPVEDGLVQSLARPGGNMTGITSEAALEIYGKRLQILKEIVPDLKRVAVLGYVVDPSRRFVMTALDQASRELGVSLVPVDIKSADDLEAAFASMRKSEADAFIVTRASLTFTVSQQIGDLALAAHLPSCHPHKEAVMAGGLVSLGTDLVAMTRPAAAQIDKIIKGTSPMVYELYINLKTARLLNLSIPPTLLALADRLIE
jgi:putative ABC transport system substrate-binding protein